MDIGGKLYWKEQFRYSSYSRFTFYERKKVKQAWKDIHLQIIQSQTIQKQRVWSKPQRVSVIKSDKFLLA